MGFFDKSNATATESMGETGKGDPQIAKYDKPKVLLVDVGEGAFEALALCGFNVRAGSFGTPYKVARGAEYQPLIGESDIPNFSEQEIVVVDLQYELASSPDGEKHRPVEEPDLWAKCDRGFIDPRPRAAMKVRNAFNRILDVGGVFVVFAAEKTGIEIKLAHKRYRDLDVDKDFPYDVWNFVGEFGDMTVSPMHGEEMQVGESTSVLGKLLSTYLRGSVYECTIEGGYRHEDRWVMLATNKFGQAVALHRSRGAKGSVIVLPQLKDKAGFLKELFTNVLPELAPHLFPHIVQGKWTHRKEYELPGILKLQAQQVELETTYRNQLAALESEVTRERQEDGWIHDLLTQTGDPLVEAVKKGLDILGFKKVIDMDIVRDKAGKSRREDLLIEDTSPLLVIDVKGIANFPGDEDVMQASKHATIRMREMGRTDVFGLALINHQRHLPPMERDNQMPFRQELIDVALESSLGLMTTWDFYRLVINTRLHGWNAKNVQQVLYRHGHIDVVPENYVYVGKVTKVWTEKFGVLIEQGTLKIGDRLAIEFAVIFEEIDADGFVVGDKAVASVTSGDRTGMSWTKERPKLKEGMRVFRINPK